MRELLVTAMLGAFWVILGGAVIYAGLVIARTPNAAPAAPVRVVEPSPEVTAGRSA